VSVDNPSLILMISHGLIISFTSTLRLLSRTILRIYSTIFALSSFLRSFLRGRKILILIIQLLQVNSISGAQRFDLTFFVCPLFLLDGCSALMMLKKGFMLVTKIY